MPKYNKKEQVTFVHRHGGPFDRGQADYYYRRPFKPHYFLGDTYSSPEIIERDMSQDEVEEYKAGWDDAKAHGDQKEYY